ncbi:MAG: nicotinate-nucleotide--dimethylbenzimidazole phosphoribosyltransferase [Salaquimonas sp.]
MSLSGLPFDDIRDLVNHLAEPDERAIGLAIQRNKELEKQFGSLGKQGELMHWLAGYSGKSPVVLRPMLALFAGTHKIAERITQLSTQPTLEIVTRLSAGGSAANQVCAAGDIGLKVFDLALQYPVADIGTNDALDEKGSAATIGFGMEAIAGGVDVLGLAAFGQGSEVANAALLSLCTQRDAEAFLMHLPNDIKEELLPLVASAVARNESAKSDGLELIRRLGGREHSAIAGAILAARTNHIPVVLEGWTSLAVVCLLQKLEKNTCDHCCFASVNEDSRKTVYDEVVAGTSLLSVLTGFGITEDGANAAQALGLLKSAARLHTDSVLES